MKNKENNFIKTLNESTDILLVGGKAINLCRLAYAGFPVPEGFVVTTEAYRFAKGGSEGMPQILKEQINAEYRKMGSPRVAVRSSATAEDMSNSSMAGQYETYLDIEGEEQLIECILKCWNSLKTRRTNAYLSQRGINADDVLMAVVVQRLVPADAAGVLFTANPRNGNKHEMLIEASWGLGESVVSGIVQPDTLILDKDTGGVKEAIIGKKNICIDPLSHKEITVPAEKQKIPCLNFTNVLELWRLGCKIKDYYGSEQDIEWAITNNKVYILQSRNITTLQDSQSSEKIYELIIENLRKLKNEGKGPFVLHNISETIPNPTPLSWSLIRRFMSPAGGYGNLYRKIGFEPDEKLGEEGFLELIGGKIYTDLSRSAGLFFRDFPFKYDLELMKKDPDACQGPPTIPAGPLSKRIKIARKLRIISRKIQELSRDFDKQFDEKIVPEFINYVKKEKNRDLKTLSMEELIELWNEREKRVLDQFAPESLLPSLIAAMAIQKLKDFCSEYYWDEDPAKIASQLTVSPEPDFTILFNHDLRRYAMGEISLSEFIDKYGHRATEEFDIASPRWREKPELKQIANNLLNSPPPLEMHSKRYREAKEKLREISNKLPEPLQKELEDLTNLAGRYIKYRENGKYYLMMGYELMRELALEIGRRLNLGNDIFMLTLTEIKSTFSTGFLPLHLIKSRKQELELRKKISLPAVITDANIDKIGKLEFDKNNELIEAFGISGGSAYGPVRIVFDPLNTAEMGKGYIMVCPNTDPSWTPLFVNAAGLVIECGGSLSHGAVVAREMGIPAVVLNNATKLFTEGEEIFIDGDRGIINRGKSRTEHSKNLNPTDNINLEYKMIPPPQGKIERRSIQLAIIFATIWLISLTLIFLSDPNFLQRPVIKIFDKILMPLLTQFGRPATVAIISFLVASGTMILQRFLTDITRLREAKRRASILQKEAKKFPKDSPSTKKFLKLAATVQNRIAIASLVPLCFILGPLVMSFIWLAARVDSAAINAKPGTPAVVTAIVDPDLNNEISINLPEGFKLDESAPAKQKIENYKQYLEKHLEQLKREKPDLRGKHITEKILITNAYNQYISDLEDFLNNGKLPDQTVSWKIFPPKNTAGRWDLSVSDGNEKLTFPIVLGEGYEPEPKEIVSQIGPRGKMISKLVQTTKAKKSNTKIKEIRVNYLETLSKNEKIFWKPLIRFEIPSDREPTTLETIFTPWLILYLIVYLPTMFFSKFLLKIP